MNPHPSRRARFAAVLAVVLMSFAILGAAGTASAALERPSYAAGDRWRYELLGSLSAFPGLNATGAEVDLALSGTVEVEVLGAADANVSVVTRAQALLSGTITIPGAPVPGPVSIQGTIFSNATELWETVGYLPIESDGRSVFAADLTIILPLHLEVETNSTATTAATPNVLFPLDIGESAVASLDTNLTVQSTVTGFGPPLTVENSTSFHTDWKRTVVSQATITVDAGTFSTYELNQSLAFGLFPGLGGGASVGNETAYFSNDVGYYVRRVVYANGTPVSELQLKSYTYAARAPPGISALTVALIVAAAAVILIPLVWLFYRRRKRPTLAPESPPPPPPGPGGGQGRE